jgi:hypothetical protein
LYQSQSFFRQEIDCFETTGKIAFFKTAGDFAFDIFAASFFLITRYEEYLPHNIDFYGRYSHENSLAFNHGFLHLPLINLWLEDFKRLLLQKYPGLKLSPPTFTFTPTYDIDIAWSYKQKGFLRNVGGLLKSLYKDQFSHVCERLAVLAGKQEDPYDSFQRLHQLHKEHQLSPIYFFLLAKKNKGYDKNILPSKVALQELINEHSLKYQVGIHPSWQSGDDNEMLLQEIDLLKKFTKIQIQQSRQHYIRMTLPETYRRLIAAGIKEDYSMGYGSINGFRASYCMPYQWYDLEKEQVTDLTIYPFCFMDANAYFEQHLTPQEALHEMEHYYRVTKRVNGHFITIWHNHFLGTDQMFKGWREIYKQMVEKIKKD